MFDAVDGTDLDNAVTHRLGDLFPLPRAVSGWTVDQTGGEGRLSRGSDALGGFPTGARQLKTTLGNS